jgi:hypothetical protein
LFSSLFFCFCVETRGFQAHLIILEEAAYIDEEIYKNVILPLKSNAYLGTVAITTPSNDLNWFSYLENLTDDQGRAIFLTIYAGTACKKCRAKGKAEDCIHGERTPWKSEYGK